MLSGINTAYSDWSKDIFEGKDAKFNFNIVPDFSKQGFQ